MRPVGPGRPARHARASASWNVANALTFVRLLLVPVFAVLLLHDDGPADGWRIAATVVFAVASLTDRIDGELARRRGLITDVGKIADPIADKALIGTALVGLSWLGELLLVGDGRRPRPRDRRHAPALRGDPARRDAGQPRRQGQDVPPGPGHRALPAAARTALARRWRRSSWRRPSWSPWSPGADYVARADEPAAHQRAGPAQAGASGPPERRRAEHERAWSAMIG